ncbi:hypothetical protein SAMN04515671_1011 [Nakamurella panacisegetis]|uniref:Uncharacterized protein n=2 Tax=Nakamurella panacisegetis TaxID=1090615 RepID=A0A1H0JRK8_9ACTN|nr:hypothetical protein SAMN04515671_1011 [Nakamurella panacisegetis]
MDSTGNDELRSELRSLRPDGDLLGLADDLRRMGVEFLLVCHPNGKIQKVVGENHIRRLARPVTAGLPYIPEQSANRNSPIESAEGEGVRTQSG